MITAAALWTVVGALSGLTGIQRMSTGDTLSGAGELFVGVAALVAAVMSGRAQRSSRKAESSSAEAAKALGPANGTTVLELLHRNQVVLDEIKAFEEYQHTRNHDVLNALARANSATPVLLKLCERLLDRLEKEEHT